MACCGCQNSCGPTTCLCRLHSTLAAGHVDTIGWTSPAAEPMQDHRRRGRCCVCLCFATHEGARTVCWLQLRPVRGSGRCRPRCRAAAGCLDGPRMILRPSSALHPHVVLRAANNTGLGYSPQGRLTSCEAQVDMCSVSASRCALMPSCCPLVPLGGVGRWQGLWCRTAPACGVLLPQGGCSSPNSSSCLSVVSALLLLLNGQGSCCCTSCVLPALQRISPGVPHSMGCRANLAQLASGATLAVTCRAQ